MFYDYSIRENDRHNETKIKTTVAKLLRLSIYIKEVRNIPREKSSQMKDNEIEGGFLVH